VERCPSDSCKPLEGVHSRLLAVILVDYNSPENDDSGTHTCLARMTSIRRDQADFVKV
jgi:hypothetical protein